MDVVNSPAGEFVISLNYEIRIGFAGTEPHLGIRANKLFGEVWADFWEIFVGEICYPSSDTSRIVPPDSLQNPNSHLLAFSSNLRETGDALPLHPSDTEASPGPKSNGYLRLNHVQVARYGRGARPSPAFAAELTSTPQIFPGEWFAVGAGSALNGQGKLEFGVVLKVELTDFEAEEGSLSARGVVLLKFYGVTLLLPLFATALAPPLTAEMEKLGITMNISRQLSDQDVRCEVTAGFHFSRADLIEKFKHRLSVQGPAGVCEMQSALAALGYSSGRIDGKAGPMYRAAAKAFALAWGLSESDIQKPVFFNFVARALAGERPQSK